MSPDFRRISMLNGILANPAILKFEADKPLEPTVAVAAHFYAAVCQTRSWTMGCLDCTAFNYRNASFSLADWELSSQ